MDKIGPDNVIPFRPRAPLFNGALRAQLETTATGYTDKPAELVTSVENVICGYIIGCVKAWASQAGDALGKKVSGYVQGQTQKL